MKSYQFFLPLLLVSALSYSAQATKTETNAITNLRPVYEKFFNSRYSLEQEFPFRLISVRGQLAEYTPQTDILTPVINFNEESFLQKSTLKGTLFNSITPILYAVTASPEQLDFLTIAKQFSGKAVKDIIANNFSTQKLLSQVQDKKINYRLFLAPYRKTDARLVYDEQKISMVRFGQVQLLNNTNSRAKVQENIAREIDLLRAKHFYTYEQKGKKQVNPTLLAARLEFRLNAQEAMLNTELLLHLYPRRIPFKESKEGINLHKFIVPSGKNFRHPVALIRINTPLPTDNATDAESLQPTMQVSFGNFSTIKDYRFVLTDQTDKSFTPHLSGKIQKAKMIDVAFQFQNINLSLLDLQAKEVEMVFSPTFRIGSLLHADLGKFRLAQIDEKFKVSINESLTELKEKIVDETVKKINEEVRATINRQPVADFFKDSLVIGLKKVLSAVESK